MAVPNTFAQKGGQRVPAAQLDENFQYLDNQVGLKQPSSSILSLFAALNPSTGKLPFFSSSTVLDLADLTAVGKDIIAQTSLATLITYMSVVSFGTAQTLNDGQKNTATSNIGAISYRVAQSLATSERLVANSNIGSLAYLIGQNLTDGEKGQGAANLGVVSYDVAQTILLTQKRRAALNIMVSPYKDVSDLPDDGVGPPFSPYAAHAAKVWWYSYEPNTHLGGAFFTATIIRKAGGSGAFGPATADGALYLSAYKENRFASTIDGEIDTLIVNVEQGRLGDAAGIAIQLSKVRTGIDEQDSGAGTPMEVRTEIMNPAAQVIKSLHWIPGFTEAKGGNSDGKGMGSSIESRKSTFYSAYHVNSTTEFVDGSAWEGANTFEWVCTASTRRTGGAAYTFYAVEWATGTVCIGVPANRRKLAYNPGSGVFSVSTQADVSLFAISSTGVISVSGTQIGAATFVKRWEDVKFTTITRAALLLNEKKETSDIPFPGVLPGDVITMTVTAVDSGLNNTFNLYGKVYAAGMVTVSQENATPANVIADSTPLALVIKAERWG